jgi:hypothetical protein
MSEIYPHPTAVAPPLRDRDKTTPVATLCLIFKLSPGEGRVLAKLMAHGHCTKDELRTVVNHNNQTVALGTLTVTVHTLRAKLKPHGIKVTTLSRLGYGLDKAARNKIYRLLVEHDEAIIPAQLQAKLETGEPEAST